MTETKNDSKQTVPDPATTRRGWLRWSLLGLAAAILLGGGLIVASGAKAARLMHGRHGAYALKDPELVKERMELLSSFLLGKVDATDDQRAQVQTILAAGIDQLAPLAEQHRQNREALVFELSQPTIDRKAVESIRQAEMALADEASRQLVGAAADVAEVLTPEQRTELVELGQRLHHR